MSDESLRLVEAQAMRYLLRASRAGEGSAAPPLLCFLHGFDEAAPLDIRAALTRHGPLRPGNPAALIDEFVIVAPQLAAAGDHWHRHADAVRRIALEEARRQGCDPRRLYLTGFSFGANGVFDIALAQVGLWAALWPVDPTRVPAREIATPVWLSLGEISRYQSREFIRRLGLSSMAGSDTPGERIWSDDGADHVGTAALAYGGERVYRWLLDRRRT